MNYKLRMKQYVKMFAQNCMLPICYAIHARKPINAGLVVFADAHHDIRPENMQQLYKALQQQAENNPQLHLEIRELYLNYQKASPFTVLKAMFDFMKVYAQAGCVVICDNFLPVASCKKRKETKVIQLWHACGALKKFGYDTADDIPKQYHGNVFKNTDLVTVSAPGCVKPFASAMRLPEENICSLGVSRTDVFYSETWREECQYEFYSRYPEAVGKRVALWAPTFRGNPGDPKLIDLDLQQLQEALGDEWLVLARLHPHMAAMKEYEKNHCKISTERLFPVIDVLIADYSSLIFEYLLFDKPLVLYVPDLEEYQMKRGFYLDYQEIPGRQVMQEEELSEAIKQEYLAYLGEKNYNENRQEHCGQQTGPQPEKSKNVEREQFIKKHMENCDGEATKRIAAFILNGNK